MWSPQGWTACREHRSEEVHPARACHVRPQLVTASHDTVARPSTAAAPLKPALTPAPMPALKATPDWAAKWRAACTLPGAPEQKCTCSNSASVRRDGSGCSSGCSSGAPGAAGEPWSAKREHENEEESSTHKLSTECEPAAFHSKSETKRHRGGDGHCHRGSRRRDRLAVNVKACCRGETAAGNPFVVGEERVRSR